MPRVSKKSKLHLNTEQLCRLEKIAKSRTAPLREAKRAQVLIKKYHEEPITVIQKTTGVSRETIYKYIEKALALGPEEALKDKYHRPKEPTITENAKMWVVNIACTKPKDHNYAAELWTQSLLAKHAREYAPKEGHTCLARAAKATIHRILKEHPVQLHKIRYYLEKRDPEFQRKMEEVLIVYQEVNLQNKQSNTKEAPSSRTITVSVDEKPGVQAIKNIAPDLRPIPGKSPQVMRDYEYKRLGTVSILASLDLHTGHVIAQVHNRHRSKEFIELLKELDAYYPTEYTIRIILDNHSAHISKETMRYLSGRPNRFIYVHTPKHGSWLNLVEVLFGKMARTFLKHIRVDSVTELRNRILKGVAEINSCPVVFRWNKFDSNLWNMSGK
ncbi:MAG: IS630 family transposase [Deltaproteobacteria bacterium]|nr:IS630 family transposase [Deltaproteobacteria bacterium]